MSQYIISNITYDSIFDVLYVNFGRTSNSYGDEDNDHLVIFKDFDTEEVTGLTIFDFKQLFKKSDKAITIASKYINTQEAYNKLCN